MKAKLVVAMGLLFVALDIVSTRAQDARKEPGQSDAKTARARWLQLCPTNEKTDAAERTMLETYSSPALEKALLSSKSFWEFLTDPSTPYMDRMTAANRGGSMLSPEDLPLLWQAIVEVSSDPPGVSPPPCSAVAAIFQPPTKQATRVVLGHQIRLPTKIIDYPVTAEERDHSPWLWQMERALSMLFDKTNMYYGDIRYPARVKAAWEWPIAASECRPEGVACDLTRSEWNKISIRSRALTESAPHDILLFQTILKLALNNSNYYIAYSAHVDDLWSWGPDHHLEELAQAAQIIILQKTRWEDVAAQTAFKAALSAQYNGDPMSAPHAKLVKTATAILAVGRWAMDKSRSPWNRYYGFVLPICKMADDAPCLSDQLRDPNDPRLDERLKSFEAWFARKKPALEKQAEAELPHLRSLAKELSTAID
ncbi:MAG TPA: hypothetical protein VKB47_01915 [Terracidiphilus sp.]|nr:hypothetical protein [Terracidiphilus sp.]